MCQLSIYGIWSGIKMLYRKGGDMIMTLCGKWGDVIIFNRVASGMKISYRKGADGTIILCGKGSELIMIWFGAKGYDY